MFSYVWLFLTLWTVAHQCPLSMKFLRQEYWSGLPFPSPGDLPHPGIKFRYPALQIDSLPSGPPGKCIENMYFWKGINIIQILSKITMSNTLVQILQTIFWTHNTLSPGPSHTYSLTKVVTYRFYFHNNHFLSTMYNNILNKISHSWYNKYTSITLRSPKTIGHGWNWSNVHHILPMSFYSFLNVFLTFNFQSD